MQYQRVGPAVVGRLMFAAMLALACAAFAHTAPAVAATTTFAPLADTWVSSETAGTNYGSEPLLELGGSGSANERHTYLRFSGTIPTGAAVTRTTLRVYFQTAPPGVYNLRLASPETTVWDESAITWNSKLPVTGPVSGDITSIAAGYNDLSAPLLRPGTSITYVLTRNGTEGAEIQSREGANPPELLVEYQMPDTTTSSVCSPVVSPIVCVDSTPWITSQSWGITIADFNGDGRDDHLITRHESNQDQIYLQQPDRTFTPGFHLDNADRHGCTAGDVNGDRRVDMYCMLGADGGEGLGLKKNELWIAQPNGSYVDEAAAWGVTDTNGRGRRPLLFDFTRDGRPDLYVTNFNPTGGASGNMLFINLGNRFEERIVSAKGDLGAACVDDGDWDVDGYRDFLVCGAELNLFHNNSGVDTEPAPRNSLLGSPLAFPRDAVLADLNDDGWDDIVVVTKTLLQIRLNQGAGNPPTRFPVSFSAPLVDARAVSVGDLTGDGRPDVYVVEGIETGAAGPSNAADKVFAAPNWSPLAVPQADTGTGDDAEFMNPCRSTLIVTNGRDFARGPIQFIGFRRTALPDDTQAPTAPASVTANAGTAARANLSWGPSTDNVGVTCYEVFRDGALLTTTTERRYSDIAVSPGTTYSYRVQALDAAGNRSTFSNLATVTTPSVPGPPPPGSGGAPQPPSPPTPPVTVTKLPKLPKAANVVQLPSSRRCATKRSIRIRIKSGGSVKFVSAEVFANGKRVKLVKQKALNAPIRLRSVPKRKFTLKVVVKTSDGRQLSRSAKYRPCAKKKRR